jgi:hypothetical protein
LSGIILFSNAGYYCPIGIGQAAAEVMLDCTFLRLHSFDSRILLTGLSGARIFIQVFFFARAIYPNWMVWINVMRDRKGGGELIARYPSYGFAAARNFFYIKKTNYFSRPAG